MTSTLGDVTKPGQVSPAMARKLLRAQQAAATADAAYRAAIREALDGEASTRAVGEVLGISHMTVGRLAKPPTE